MIDSSKSLNELLFEMQDASYKEFHKKLMPNIDENRIIGIRVPILKKFAKEYANSGESEKFLNTLPHFYYEENNLHALLIMKIKDYDKLMYRLDEFLPYVDNWATCDMIAPEVFKKHSKDQLSKIAEWIKSDKTYTVRFAIGMLMKYYLDEYFDEKYMEMVIGVKSEEYYVNMMIAWYMATALAKQYDSAIEVLKQRRLSPWIHNKTIQKALESCRVDDEVKEVIRGWRWK